MDDGIQIREAILKARAARLARRHGPKAEAAEDLAGWLFFRRSRRIFGLETSCVLEAQVLGGLTPIPCVPPFIMGVTALRGRVVAIMDLPLFLGLDAGLVPETPAVVIARGHGLETALLADEVLGVQSLAETDKLPAPANLPLALAALCRGVTTQGWLLLDGDALLTDQNLLVEERV
ncbi:chemotaxis protein CheW [Desulfocurvibacter africanus]|uniref:chemotaxis protein CheW n=1 Tax=Desulfocurvibacter africanus TaxID=873 RepID=UPI002FD9F711